jgi:hypothetical protein
LLRHGKPSIAPAKEDEMVLEHNFMARETRQPDDPGNVTEADRADLMAPADRAIVVMWVMAFVAVSCLALAMWFSPAHSRPHPLDVARAGVACVGVKP